MPLPIITNTWRCEINWTYGAQRAVNVLHVRDTTGAQTAANLAADLNTSVTANQFNMITNAADVSNFDLTRLDGSSATVTYAAGVTWTGQVGSSDGIPQACVLIGIRTALRGARHRGRLYLPYLAETQQNGGLLTGASVSACSTAWNTFATNMFTAGWEVGVASYAYSDFTPQILMSCGDWSATQRRRQSRNRV